MSASVEARLPAKNESDVTFMMPITHGRVRRNCLWGRYRVYVLNACCISMSSKNGEPELAVGLAMEHDEVRVSCQACVAVLCGSSFGLSCALSR